VPFTATANTPFTLLALTNDFGTAGSFRATANGIALITESTGSGRAFVSRNLGPAGHAGEFFGQSENSEPVVYIHGGGPTVPALAVERSGANQVAAYLRGALRIGVDEVEEFGSSTAKATILPDEGDGYPALRLYEFNPFIGTARPAVEVDAHSNGGGSAIRMYRQGGVRTVNLIAEEFSGEGARFELANSAGTPTIIANADNGVGNGVPRMDLRDASGITRISFNVGASGGARVVTQVLEITGGADLVEGFESGEECEPGSVVVIDPTRPGELALSTESYDAKVAGVVSGANGIQAGLRMGQEGVASGDTLVAMTGRVYVKASAENGAIRPGDLLTTASLAGHAMRASDPERSFGSVIGKAMSALDEGTGLVLVLVNLQ
jgi:hypothetical protein